MKRAADFTAALYKLP